jgi:hypothetical protein
MADRPRDPDAPANRSFARDGRGDAAGADMAEVLNLPDAERSIVNWLIRRGAARLNEVAEGVRRDPGATRDLLEALAQRGLVLVDGAADEPRYRAQLAPRRRAPRTLDILKSLEDE